MQSKANDMPGSGPMFDAQGAFTPSWGSWLSMVRNTIQSTRAYGPTSERPTKDLYPGRYFYDTDLNKPIWVSAVNPTVWRDAASAPV